VSYGVGLASLALVTDFRMIIACECRSQPACLGSPSSFLSYELVLGCGRPVLFGRQ